MGSILLAGLYGKAWLFVALSGFALWVAICCFFWFRFLSRYLHRPLTVQTSNRTDTPTVHAPNRTDPLTMGFCTVNGSVRLRGVFC